MTAEGSVPSTEAGAPARAIVPAPCTGEDNDRRDAMSPAGRTGSLNRIASTPAPRSSIGFPSRPGGAVSRLTATATSSPPAYGTPSRSGTARCAMSRRTGGADELACDMSCICCAVRRSTTTVPSCPRDAAAPLRDTLSPPSAPSNTTADSTNAPASTNSSNVSESVPAAKLSRGGEAAASRGGAVSARTSSAAPRTCADGFHDRSANAPRAALAASASSPARPPAQCPAAAFCAGVSTTTTPGAASPGTPGVSAWAGGASAARTPAAPDRLPPAGAPSHAGPAPLPGTAPVPLDSPSDKSDGSAAETLTYSSNRTVSVPAPRSRTGRAAVSMRGATESATASRAARSTRLFGFSAMSENAPGSAVVDRAAGTLDVPAHADAAAFWAGVSKITTPGAASPGTPGAAASISTASISAPASGTLPSSGDLHIPPPPPPSAAADSDTREEFDAGTSTYSSNRTVSVPAPRSRTGRVSSSRIGPAASSITVRLADAAALGFPDGSANVPEARSALSAFDAAAAAFSAGESDKTAPTADAAPGSAGAAAATSDIVSAMRSCPIAPISSTRDGRAAAIATCSSKRTSSVPAVKSRLGVSPVTDRRGAAVSSITCIR